MATLISPVESRRTGVRQKHDAPGRELSQTVMAGAQGAEIAITVKPILGEEMDATFRRLARELEKRKATLLYLMVYGSVSAFAAGTEIMRRVFGGIEWPMLWVESSACDGNALAGLQAFAFAGGDVRRIKKAGRVIGSIYSDGEFRCCLLGGMEAARLSASRTDQTRESFDNFGAALADGGFRFHDVVRTWFYLDDLLHWYGDFNAVRTRFYSGIKFQTGSLPASTGISARNPASAALSVGALAVQRLSDTAQAKEIPSPLQCPAPAYGSSFSRAMEISSMAGRRLFISGTASIAPDGRTLWPKDCRMQVSQTMRVVEAILQSRGFSLLDLTRATAYFKHRSHARYLHEWCAGHRQFFLPAVSVHSDICRHDLLFEFEADAWSSTK